MMTTGRAALAGFVVLFAGCTVPPGIPAGSTSAPGEQASGAAITAVARAVVAEVNHTRQENGLAPLREDALLSRAAREHSEELASRRTLTHTSTNPARRTMTMRIEAVGVVWSRAAENLANMSGSASSVPEQTARMWMGSDGHRRNMLEPAYTHTGVGVAIDQRGIWYITQLYVLPR
ncbi:MAG: CAP domain-containing protein [Gemmatimonadetes bacterium]|nr:CAP domain-containing protein [Gemmatimonadota bacterium]